ncbi:MAG: hypothetical protein IKI93_19300, partial [Clostridia bacterium]|nr:hypothetical protein [Clostridia bacterium]
ERFEAVFYGGSISFLDIIIFLLIYLLYYTLHEFIIWRIYRNEYSSHIRFLEGSKKEYEKEQKIYKPI